MQTETQFLDTVQSLINGRRAELASPTKTTLPGINLAGGDWAGNKLPGVLGRDYGYPQDPIFATVAGWGFKLGRLPFLIERIQPSDHAEFTTDIKELDRCVLAAGKANLNILLDAHNYGRRAGVKFTVNDLTNLWWRLAERYKNQTHVHYGVMNEPSAFGATDWQPVLRETVKAIRNSGASSKIFVPGAGWNGAHDFTTAGNSASFEGFVDPGNNFVIETHQYLDGDNSGSHQQEYVSGKGATVLVNITKWLRSKGWKGFLAEYGFAMPAGETETKALLQYMNANSDVWLGHSVWAYGDWFTENVFYVGPTSSGSPNPQAALIKTLI